MSEIISSRDRRGRQAKSFANVVYVVYIVGLFTVGLVTIAGLIMAYIKRGNAAGTWVESHYSWLIRTFWWSLLFTIIGILLLNVMIGIPILFLTGLWYVYRLVKGFIYLNDLRAVDASAWF